MEERPYILLVDTRTPRKSSLEVASFIVLRKTNGILMKVLSSTCLEVRAAAAYLKSQLSLYLVDIIKIWAH